MASTDRKTPNLESDLVDAKARCGMERLGLGTVQFGVDYGISNDLGQCSPEETGRILSEAKRLGVRVLDTAPSYGEAEKTIGHCAPAESSFKIITKTVPVENAAVTSQDAELLVEQYRQSRARMNIDSAYGLLVHHADDLLKPGGERLMAALQQLKSEGLVSKIGVSVYNGAQLDLLLDRYPFDLVQLPLNVFDQRLIRSGHLSELKKRGVEIHARSVFLQGLLLMSGDGIPKHFGAAREHIVAFHAALEENSISKAEAALSFARSVLEIDVVLVGVASVEQLGQNVAAFQSRNDLDYAAFALDDVSILDPQKWKLS